MNRSAPAPERITLLISHRYQFIFLKTHKTAGTSVEVALEHLCAPPGVETGMHYRDQHVSEAGIIGARGGAAQSADWRNHMSARAIRTKVGRQVWNRYYRFSIIRNPYDRMVSMFWSRMEKPDRVVLRSAPFATVKSRFHQWLAAQGTSNNLNKLTIGPRLCVHYVLRYEHLAEDFADLTSELEGAPISLPRLKTNRRKRTEHWRDYYDDQAKKHVKRSAAFELAFFGYDFDGGPSDLSSGARARRLATTSPAHLFAAFQPLQKKAQKIHLNHLDAPLSAP
ncbi:MAG: sulfotransferase family 2 domain-containing protein [Pikeienuella sp.]